MIWNGRRFLLDTFPDLLDLRLWCLFLITIHSNILLELCFLIWILIQTTLLVQEAA